MSLATPTVDVDTQKKKGRHKRRRRQHREPTLREKLTGLLLLLFSCVYLLFLWRTQSFLETLEAKGSFRIPELIRMGHLALANARAPPHKLPQHLIPTPAFNKLPPATRRSQTDKYFVFEGIMGGQGEGNAMSGLLAAHLLGYEFDRTVCVSDRWTPFHAAFQAIHPDAVTYCPTVLRKWDVNYLHVKRTTLLNFEGPPNECQLQQLFNSTEPIVGLSANTYPRWPKVPDNFFFSYYKAKPALLNMLSYHEQQPPPVVVHLREPDAVESDPRQGLTDEALRALGKMLPQAYLVTNRVEWYDLPYFAHWQHPAWREVVHSAFERSWGSRGQHYKPVEGEFIEPVLKFDHERQNLQLWADWYTLVTAKKVIHTHSDFSLSAIHWQNIDSQTIGDWNPETHELELHPESWRADGETARLVDRRIDAPGTSALRLCNLRTAGQDDDKVLDDDAPAE